MAMKYDLMRLIAAVAILTTGFSSRAQTYTGLWHLASQSWINEKGKPIIQPERFSAFTVSEEALRSYLATCPEDPNQAKLLDLPTPDGTVKSFRVWSTPVMEKALADKYPEITTYTAEQVDHPGITAKLDYTVKGFHAFIFDGSNTYLIDPYNDRPDGAYIAYRKYDDNLPDYLHMHCDLASDELPKAGEEILTHSRLPNMQRVNGTLRKSYRLALACTGEYAVAVAGATPTKAAVLSKMVTSVNRVVGVYEREVSVTMFLIAQEDTLIFLDGTTDPYSNTNGSAMLGQNQSVVDARIGTANYDIGHVFSTGGGGIASLGCVCRSGYKAEGVTGSPSPVNDAFDIDYVAHEMGHQFGANHTFNANTGSCQGNGVVARAYEPGSGTTIMAYAGICLTNNTAAHSDPYFHFASLDEISAFITNNSTGSSCAITTTSTNTNASLPSFAAAYYIPFRTPFELIAPVATDPTASDLTYCWEEQDLGDFGMGVATADTPSTGPLFRSFPPDAGRSRTFITLFRLLAGQTSYIAEKLPQVDRDVTFKLTERDFYQGWGAFNTPTDVVTLHAVNTGTPFTVTAPVDTDIWTGGDTRTITWNVVGTDAAPISCTAVDIELSIDGGYTYPYTVISNTPNDGSQTVVLPNPPTSSDCRIRVKSRGNVFFNISLGFAMNHGTVGVATNTLADQIVISPVPAHDQLQIVLPDALGNVKARVLNALGQQVWAGSLKGKQSLPVHAWAPGMYALQIDGSGVPMVSRRFIVE
jgi:hypothetical protein